MAGEWFEGVLADACASIDYGFTASAAEHKVGPKFLRITDIVSDHIDWNTVPHVDADEATFEKYQLNDGDIVLARTGASTGASAYVKKPLSAVFASYLVRLKAKPEFDARFLSYYLRSDCFKGFIRAVLGDKSAQPNASASTMTKAPLRVPSDKNTQRAIAHILGTLDDKIELNRRMNETLEAIARAMFKSWFVNFDPVRAKMSGEPPESICQRLGLTPELLALFPARLVDSELGEIPDGWEVKPLEKLTSYLNRGISPKYIEDAGILVLNQKCVRDGYVDTSKGRRHDPTQRKVDGRHLENGDILVNSTGVGTLGRVAQILSISEPTIVDSHVTVVRADPGKVSWNYLGITLLGRQNEIEALGEGSTGQTELSRARLGTISILVPPKLLRIHFDDCVVNLRLHTSSNNTENVTLAQARDALLPKLLTGELQVPVTGAA